MVALFVLYKVNSMLKLPMEIRLKSRSNSKVLARNGFTWLILMQLLGAAKIALCWLKLSESLILKSSYQVGYVMMNLYVVHLRQDVDASISVLQPLKIQKWTARVIAEHGDRIAVGLDVRGHVLAARGWTKEGGDLFETIERLERDGCARYVVTDVTKDGTLKGPNLELLKEVCAATRKPVIASGGISSLEDIAALSTLTNSGVEGAIVGKALYAGAFTLQQALEVTQR
jgi:phosphoribosylformimino-5-aminoimidazole carboxamide ribonucleotide (ProFAR) isomerase